MFSKQPPSSPPLSFSAKAARTEESPISSLMAMALHNPNLISFAAGLVDAPTLPVEQCAAITRRIFADRRRGQSALQYGTTLGLKPLRERLLSHLASLEGRPAAAFGITADDIIVTTGSQQTLYLIADVLVDPGDIVIAGNPSYFVFTGTLQSLGATVHSVPMDEDGMDVDTLERLLERLDDAGQLGRVKFVYCVSYYDNPTGQTLSQERRERLVEVVKRFSRSHRILILEDAAYREMGYDTWILPSIKSFDPDNRYTILTQTFSKPFAPGLKLGYTAMPCDLMHAVLRQKGSHDFGSSNLCQEIVLEALRDGSYRTHLQVLRSQYRGKRDAVLSALEAHMPGGVGWTTPKGGMYVWLTFPRAIDTSARGAMFNRCIERGVLYVPGDYCFHPDESGQVPQNCLRLCFGQVSHDQIDTGIQHLGKVVGELLKTTPIVLGDSLGCCSLNPEPRTRSHE
ncbi:MAG: PLP-dependent aminotransferase family protein [Planctomycetota bacterium]|nr:PLP-dependent aminotransferase family protein [Planctomycetota bacterium]